MNETVNFKQLNLEIAEKREVEAEYEVEDFDLYGRHHEVRDARAVVGVTRVSEGLHLELDVTCTIDTSCDRTLEPVEVVVGFSETEFLSGPDSEEVSVENWVLNVRRYTERALPAEVPLQVFCSGTAPVRPESREGEKDPRWKALDDLFASGF